MIKWDLIKLDCFIDSHFTSLIKKKKNSSNIYYSAPY